MTKKEYKEKIESAISLAGLLNKAMDGHMESFRIVSVDMFDGGKVSFYYDLTKNLLGAHLKNHQEEHRFNVELEDVPEKLTDILAASACVASKYTWLGE